ncbi:3'-5' exonuclease [Marinobacterium sp. MBR-109]|jgi:superfamily I DNA/RNA helicase|uniref:3'-5' exonuclease n=1 Tax=Marinobacterium sp. MBR-109 TaxID=3156462 RepID=UPI00339B3DF9
MHGPAPEVKCFSDATEQADAILAAIQVQGLAPEACCVIARTHKELGDTKARLENRQQLCHQLDGRGAATPDGALNLATMHRVKGLEFDAVFIASANRGLVPLEFVVSSAADAVTRRQRENEERAGLRQPDPRPQAGVCVWVWRYE